MKRFLWLFLLLLIPSRSHAQQAVIGATCPASGQSAISTTGAPVICTLPPSGVPPPVWTVVGGGSGGGSSPSAVGPVFNVMNPAYAGGASPSLVDNNAAFTAAFAASAASNVGAANPTAEQAVIGTSCSTACTSITTNVSILANDAIFVGITGSAAARTFTVTDNASGGSNFYSLQLPAVTNAGNIRIYASLPGVTKAATSVTITDSGSAENLGMMVLTVKNVSGYRITTQSFGGFGTSGPTIGITTTDPNNMVISMYSWFNGAVITASANTGTLQASQASGASVDGEAIVTQSTASAGTLVTNAITLSGSPNWSVLAIELRSVTPNIPTVYFPGGQGVTYYYSGGLNPTRPTNIECQRGTALYYTGSAHAVDIGPTGLTALTQQYPYFIKGCTFTGGANATEGIFLQPFITKFGMSEFYLFNFGAPGVATYFMIAGANDNWDVEIGPQGRIETIDYLPRNVLKLNLNNTNGFSFLRFHDNNMFCEGGAGTGGGGSTQGTATTCGVGIWMNAANSRVYHNNLAFFNPDIVVAGYGNEIAYNQVETVQTGTGTAPILFNSGSDFLVVHENTFDLHSTTNGALAPFGGSDGIKGLRFNFNSIYDLGADTNPVITLNNVAGQTANQSSNNICALAGSSGAHPCVMAHTTGANITPFNFNIDDNLNATGQQPTITGTGACATFTASSQKGSWAGQIGCSGTTGASNFTITPGNSAPNGMSCLAFDITHPLWALPVSSSATACTVSFTSVTAADIISFQVTEY